MPVTAKLSRKFYEKLGDDVANELVEWLNTVDTAYRSELREINDYNIARFEAKLDQRIAESEARLGDRINGVERRVADVQTRMLAWSFAFWVTTLLTILGSRLL